MTANLLNFFNYPVIPTALTYQWQESEWSYKPAKINKVNSKLYSHPSFNMYMHSLSFNPQVRLHAHSAEWTVGLYNLIIQQVEINIHTIQIMWRMPVIEPVTTGLSSVN